jgi:hypothetical protein
VSLEVEELLVYPGGAGDGWVSKPLGEEAVAVNSPVLIVARGSLTLEGHRFQLPLELGRGLYLYLLAERGEAQVLREILETGLKDDLEDALEDAYDPERPGVVSLPREAPEGVYLDLDLTVSGTPVEARVRFEVNGEAMGIHGLVVDVVVVDSGLSDIYITVEPPVVEGYFNSYHSLIVEYCSHAAGVLPRSEYLALLAVLASGYLGAARSHMEAALSVQQAVIDLYLLAERGAGRQAIEEGGVRVAVKVIPGVDLVWIGSLAMTAGGLALALPLPDALLRPAVGARG